MFGSPVSGSLEITSGSVTKGPPSPGQQDHEQAVDGVADLEALLPGAHPRDQRRQRRAQQHEAQTDQNAAPDHIGPRCAAPRVSTRQTTKANSMKP